MFYLQSGQKIAFSYVTRGIICKINMQELWVLCMTHHRNVLYKCMKFLEISLMFIKLLSGHDFVTDRQTDLQKNNMSPDPSRGRHNNATELPPINNPASNLGYLAPPRTIFHGCKIVHWDPLDAKRRCPQKNLVWAMCNCMVSMATHSEFEKGGLPTKLLISQLLLIQDY